MVELVGETTANSISLTSLKRNLIYVSLPLAPITSPGSKQRAEAAVQASIENVLLAPRFFMF